MSSKLSQADRVLDYMLRHGGITRVDALMNLGIANLPAVIEIMRHRHGHNIITKEIAGRNRYGEPVTYARYILGEEDLE